MATTNPESHAAEVGSFLSSLLGLKVTASDSDSLQNADVVATYVDSDGTPKGYLMCDIPAGAILGAALTQIPMGSVSDSIEAGKLADNLQENVSEVFNIAVNLLPNHDSHRLVLSSVGFCDDSCVPALASDAQIEDYEIDVQRYGKGTIRVVTIE